MQRPTQQRGIATKAQKLVVLIGLVVIVAMTIAGVTQQMLRDPIAEQQAASGGR